MASIRILPEVLSNKIAAGEVVERPASVVKELIENALDAHASKIIVEIRQGGRSLIRISDDGIGMSRDDALLAIERYATSKIRSDKDLFAIGTLGFRGEALPSIASISRFVMETRDASSDAGVRLDIEGGRLKKVTEIGIPQGTQISVQDLFFNTPARRKFLKTVGTETGHIADTVSSIALGNPKVQFQLDHNGRPVKFWMKTDQTVDRVIDVLGKDCKNALIPVALSENDIAIEGFISFPEYYRSTSRGIYIFVNGRYVRDRMVQHALFAGYKGRILKGRYPVCVLYITVPSSQVDVNVHPTKSEVRFFDQNRVHEMVVKAVTSGLNRAHRIPQNQIRADIDPSETEDTRISESHAPFSEPEKANVPSNDKPVPPAPAATEPLKEKETGSVSRENAGQQDLPGPMINRRSSPQQSMWPKSRFGDLSIIGQFRNTYIVCESDEGLILIDQHAAHERVVYEQIIQSRQGQRFQVQHLLIPETIELGYTEAAVFESLLDRFQTVGLEIEPFGGRTFAIRAVPAMLSNRDVRPLVLEIVEKVVDATGGDVQVAPDLDELIDQCARVMACHGAIRANQTLTDAEMKALLKEMDRCNDPFHCPHGRPTWIQWSDRVVEKSFGRIV